jgi:hypothetical protein
MCYDLFSTIYTNPAEQRPHKYSSGMPALNNIIDITKLLYTYCDNKSSRLLCQKGAKVLLFQAMSRHFATEENLILLPDPGRSSHSFH